MLVLALFSQGITFLAKIWGSDAVCTLKTKNRHLRSDEHLRVRISNYEMFPRFSAFSQDPMSQNRWFMYSVACINCILRYIDITYPKSQRAKQRNLPNERPFFIFLNYFTSHLHHHIQLAFLNLHEEIQTSEISFSCKRPYLVGRPWVFVSTSILTLYGHSSRLTSPLPQIPTLRTS